MLPWGTQPQHATPPCWRFTCCTEPCEICNLQRTIKLYFWFSENQKYCLGLKNWALRRVLEETAVQWCCPQRPHRYDVWELLPPCPCQVCHYLAASRISIIWMIQLREAEEGSRRARAEAEWLPHNHFSPLGQIFLYQSQSRWNVYTVQGFQAAISPPCSDSCFAQQSVSDWESHICHWLPSLMYVRWVTAYREELPV